MSIEYMNAKAVFREDVGIDEADDLLQWLQRNPGAKIDLSCCAYLHPTNVRALLSSRATVVAWPTPPTWRIRLESVIYPLLGRL
jgi:hypothetical protein